MSREVWGILKAGPLDRDRNTVPESGETGGRVQAAGWLWKEHQLGRGYDLGYKWDKFSRAKKADPENAQWLTI